MESNMQEQAVVADSARTLFSAPARQIESILLHAAKRDVRTYLNGILFEHRNGIGRMCATDGLSLIVAKCPVYLGPSVSAIVPREIMEAALKSLGKKGRDSQNLSVEVIGAKVTVLTVGGASFAGQLIDGSFPDYRRVLPVSSFDQSQAVISGYLIDRFDRSAAIWAGKPVGSMFCTYRTRTDSAALVSLGADDEAIGVVMPRRDECAIDRTPEWAME